MSPAMGVEELRALPVTVDVPTAGRAFGLGRSLSFELARCGDFPCRVLRCGRLLRVARADLLAALGADDTGAGPALAAVP
jgi:hypothetical protein